MIKKSSIAQRATEDGAGEACHRDSSIEKTLHYMKLHVSNRACQSDILSIMKQVDTISISELSEMAQKMYGNLVKGVVDLNKNILVVDVEMHVDAEQFLLENGSIQNDLWGINLYPAKFNTDEFIEFDSMINIRPRQNNMSRSVEDEKIRQQIALLVSQKVK